MRAYLKACFVFLLFVSLAVPASAQYFKSGNELMVRVAIRYAGPEDSSHLRQDTKGIALKEANAAKIRAAMESVGGKVGHSFRHLNVISGSVPVKRLPDLWKQKEVLEIAKDTLWHPLFDPARASMEEKKAFAKEKVEKAKARIQQRLSDSSSLKKNPSGILARAKKTGQEKKKEKSLVNKVQPWKVTNIASLSALDVDSFLIDKGIDPNTYAFYNNQTIKASAVWPEANFGEGMIIAVIDSGTYAGHSLLSGSVIGGENAPGIEELEESLDNNGDGIPDGLSFGPTVIENNFHGTGTAAMIAAHGTLVLPSNNRLLRAIEAHAPNTVVNNGNGTKSVLLFGSAPRASIFAMKVLPYTGGGTFSSIVLAGIERIIDLKSAYLAGKNSGINIEVVNLSLGGVDLFPAFDAESKLVDTLVDVGIQPVIASGNSGPSAYTIASPASALKGITVGASAGPKENRILYEGVFFPELPVGGGTDMVLSNRTQMAVFSSHGPLATGYGKPDVVAEGNAVITAILTDSDGDGINDSQGVGITSGTSFSSPTTAGAVALLLAVAKANDINPRGQVVKTALLRSAKHLPGFEEYEQGFGLIDVAAASAYLKANPTEKASKLNNRKNKFKGSAPFSFIDLGTATVVLGATNPLLPGEQDDFLVPQSTSDTDQSFYGLLYLYGVNPQRIKPFPGIVRDTFDVAPNDGVPPFAALQQNTEIYYADGVNSGFSDGDYIIGSLNMVDTYYNNGQQTAGYLQWAPDFFPGLTAISIGGFLPGPGAPLATNVPSAFAGVNPHQQMGSGGLPDLDRLTIVGDVTNDGTQTVQTAFTWIQIMRSGFTGPCFGGTSLCTGLPSLSGTIAQNQVKEFDLTLPAPGAFYQFQLSFEDGFNNYRFGPSVFPVAGRKKKTADVDMLVEAPDGSLLNLDAIPGIVQGASFNDVEMIHNLFGFAGGGRFHVTVIGFDVKGVQEKRTDWGIRVWDNFIPINPVP